MATKDDASSNVTAFFEQSRRTNSDANLDRIQRTRELLHESFSETKAEIQELLASSATVRTADDVEILLEDIAEIRNRFKALTEDEMNNINRLNKTAEAIAMEEASLWNESRAMEKEFRQLNMEFKQLKRRLSAATSSNPPNETLNRTMNVSNPRQVEIAVPTFNGNAREFMSFKNLFKKLVHEDATLTDLQRMFYLKQALKGDAAKVLRDFDIDDDSYQDAWSAILQRYENQAAIIRTHVRDLVELEATRGKSDIRHLLDNVNAIVRGLKSCGVKPCCTEDNEVNCSLAPVLTCIVAMKLDDRTNEDWYNSTPDSTKLPSFESLINFLHKRSSNLEATLKDKPTNSKSPTRRSSADDSRSTNKPLRFRRMFPTSKSRCFACSESHLLFRCPQFQAKTPVERYEIVKSNRLCSNCFNPNHKTIDCKSGNCTICSLKHHTLLHRDFHRERLNSTTSRSNPNSTSSSSSTSNNNDHTANSNNNQSSNGSNNSSSSNKDNGGDAKSKVILTTTRAPIKPTERDTKTVLLPTAVVRIATPSGEVLARVMLDSCSEITAVSKSFAIRHRLPSIISPYGETEIRGISDNSIVLNRFVELNIRSRYNSFSLNLDADIIPELPYRVRTVFLRELQGRYPNRKFGEIELSHNKVDILIGSEYYELCLKKHRIIDMSVTLRDTQFGYVTLGATTTKELSCFTAISNHPTTNDDVDMQLQRFWELESVPEPIIATETDECVQHFETTHSRDVDGRFVVRLPFKTNPIELGDSHNRALRVLNRSEKFSRIELQRPYNDFMEEYKSLNHMELINTTEGSNYFIPHHAVLKPTSTTTKLRVVFNASAKTSSGKSLNDILMVGPCIQPELFDILIRFRVHKVAIAGDIEKMYRQVLVHQDDRKYQQILWRDSLESSVKMYQLKTVTYGIAPASFLTTKCLSILANENSSSKPAASNAVSNSFYMDDLMTGAPSNDEARELLNDIRTVLMQGQFPLRKIMSNSAELLDELPTDVTEKLQGHNVSDPSLHILGLLWSPSSDQFGINLNLHSLPAVMTKRIILSEISRIFDPLGFLSPIVINAKTTIQDLWREELGWDDPVPEQISKKFEDFYRELPLLKDFRINRPYSSVDNPAKKQLIGFADASERAYCAVVFLRAVGSCNVTSYLICSKTRVAPIKSLTIPRLELCAALLLSNLLERLTSILSICRENVYAFSDSKIVLSWLKSDPTRFQTFVRNRISKIVTITPSNRWNYVASAENPADSGTRGLSARQFLNATSWLTGPDWLIHDFDNHIQFERTSLNVELPEVRKTIHATVTATNDISSDVKAMIAHHSSFTRLVHTMSYILRFISNCRRKDISKLPTIPILLSVSERSTAINRLIIISQASNFQREIDCIKLNIELQKKSVLKRLSPFVDENGVMRVGGRLKNSIVPYDVKYPIIMHKNDPFIKLYSTHIHLKYFHSNLSFMLNIIRSQFWIVGGISSVIRRVIHTCVHCIRLRAQVIEQKMGNLPFSRVSISRPFTHTGVDLCGPFTTKCTGHRSTKFSKAYAAFFVCMATRAVHIEIVSDLSSLTFLAALQRFASRRGLPREICSDNATNFTGLNNLFQREHTKINEHCVENNIKWTFIPPRSPHHGGLWEAAVKAGKRCLLNATAEHSFSFEELATIFAKIEAVLNSRPLCYRTMTNDTYEVITPGHLLIGSSLLAVPEFDTLKATITKRWDLLQHITKSIWINWKNNYLQQLQVRSKWNVSKLNLCIGDVVLLKDELSAPQRWPMGLVCEVYPDSEGAVRIVDVRTSGGTYRRSVAKLVQLPVTT